MIELFHRIEERATSMRLPNDWHVPAVLEYEERPLGPSEVPYREEFEFSVKVAIRMLTNGAMIFDTRRDAQKALARLLFSDMRRELDVLDRAIAGGSREAAYQAACNLRKIAEGDAS